MNDYSLCQSGKTDTLFHSDLKDMLKTYFIDGKFQDFDLAHILEDGKLPLPK